MRAIAKVRQLEESQLFRPGLYYIALTDLVGSTIASRQLGVDLNKRRVETFITASVEALGQIQLSNYAQFVKEIGDATLFIFSSFDDLYNWWKQAAHNYGTYNYFNEGELSVEQESAFAIRARTVVHLGEVAYSSRSNPVALAVNQVFKIEKMFTAGQLGVTDVVRQAADPSLVAKGLVPVKHQDVILPGRTESSSTWIIDTFEFSL